MHIDRARGIKHSFTMIKYFAVHLPVVYRRNNREDNTADMSSALFQKDVFTPCSFYHPKTMLFYSKQRHVKHYDQVENGLSSGSLFPLV